MNKKLYRSTSDVKISGVCAGIAEYFGMDATIVRLIWVLGTLMNVFIGIVAYVACVFIVPEDPGCIDVDYKEKQ
ncbi:MAG: PspC domain-containing protein [Eubacterium sp.]|nr:PspC domain-containing protein [Anaerotignum sp.]MBQ7757463.1 PspC domain-containing protein [Anaerotignum sp.]MBQ8662463.1 PspC domain-containing protein [Eubacterium sp.]